MKQFYVYSISINDEVRYVGRTEDLDKRELSHLKDCYYPKSAHYNKQFYQYVRTIYPTKDSAANALFLTPVGVFDTLAESKKWEAYLILKDYFTDKKLLQSVPKITDKRW